MSDYDPNKFLESLFDVNDRNWNPSEKIPHVKTEIERIKEEIRLILNSGDHDVAAILAESKELCQESMLLVADMTSCQQSIQEETMTDIHKSIENHVQLTNEMLRINFSIEIIYYVLRCGMFVKEFDDGREAQSFTRAVEAVYDLVQYLETPTVELSSLDLYNNMKQSAQSILDNLLQELSSEWDQLLDWNKEGSTKTTVITITLKIDESNLSLDVIQALDKCKKLPVKISEFAQFLQKEVLVPIIHKDCSVIAETDNLITVTINERKNYKPPFDTVISNLRLVFRILNRKLKIEYERDCILMEMLGKEICEDFCDVLVRDCLIDTIPDNILELQFYARITAEIQEFQNFLVVVKVFPKDNLPILRYMKNIDVHFANKCSQYFLERARSIMLKDLSATMSIGVETVPDEVESSNQPAAGPVDESSEEALEILDKTIPKSLFYFPRCMISKTAQELLDLVYMIMEQGVQCSEVVCQKLYNTSRLVFELYDAVVPYYHENYLQTIPQYVALFHNNCMYLAHNLLTFGEKWLLLMEGQEPRFVISFLDLVPRLRALGTKHLAQHMQQQRKQILDNIRSSDLNSIVSKDVLGENAEAAIRQCLRQLQLLKNVWIGVFPANVFTRLLATLVGMLAEELVHRACAAEDLSVELAAQLGDMYAHVVRKAPQLFQNPSDIEVHVPTWAKLQELLFILGGSLKDIEAHWADGRGPLAVHFRTEELRSLIKALFQNTQFRANLLSKIK